MRIAIIVIVVLALVGCSSSASSNEPDIRWTAFGRNNYRVIDCDAQVVCYRMGISIDCMLLSDTKLSLEYCE